MRAAYPASSAMPPQAVIGLSVKVRAIGFWVCNVVVCMCTVLFLQGRFRV
jgi:hypothetical protein